MLINMYKGKIHRATVTEANLNYVGSITIDSLLLEAAGIVPGERVQIVNNNNGERLETYTISGPPAVASSASTERRPGWCSRETPSSSSPMPGWRRPRLRLSGPGWSLWTAATAWWARRIMKPTEISEISIKKCLAHFCRGIQPTGSYSQR